jgi:hypothetical protein
MGGFFNPTFNPTLTGSPKKNEIFLSNSYYLLLI